PEPENHRRLRFPRGRAPQQRLPPRFSMPPLGLERFENLPPLAVDFPHMADEEFVDPLIGAKLGPCRVEERLAAGGMGVVYRARHTLLDQDVAVKILAPSLAADQEYVTRFFREAGAAGQIDHPNVIRVIDVGKYEDRYYLVMEYVA